MERDGTDDVDWDEWSWETIVSREGCIEFDWFAVDAIGHVAALSSFGTGPSPVSVRESRERFNTLLRRVACLPQVTSARVESGCLYGDTESWQAYARRGLFGYDNGDVHAPHLKRYERIACPAVPISVAELGMSADLLLCLPRLPVIFADSLWIDFVCLPA